MNDIPKFSKQFEEEEMRKTILIFALALIGVLGFGVVQSQRGTPPKIRCGSREYLVTIGGCNDCHTPKFLPIMVPSPI